LCATVWKTKTEPSLALPKSSSIASRSRPIVCCATHAHTHRFSQHAACLSSGLSSGRTVLWHMLHFRPSMMHALEQVEEASRQIILQQCLQQRHTIFTCHPSVYSDPTDPQSTKRDCTLLLPACDACYMSPSLCTDIQLFWYHKLSRWRRSIALSHSLSSMRTLALSLFHAMLVVCPSYACSSLNP
jgi:hypothetical protein